ncbi:MULTISPECIES: LysR family transcriptional regulator [Vibrio]|uniref:LysR family transcriptional regulator n=1 Tax=Vibrio TaxID=662 RepID=UPI0002EBB577|nr:LysR family transcriptional regulator [Vibrio tasmaniensis]OEF80842.1 transcriptional regulator [Vibrio tasmaniensis 1F-155]PMO76884.1 transcriptional regulator [Vibrio tasmaniensis]
MTKDLNLLRLILVLNETRQTVSAAKTLNVSQPTISVMLRKLREQFDDELFVRDKARLEPTPKCLKLIETLPLLLEQLDNLYIPNDEWGLEDLRGEVQIMLPSPLLIPVGVPLIKKLTKEAPQVTFQCSPWLDNGVQSLETNRMCWGVSYLPMDVNKTLTERPVGFDKFMLVLRADHPIQGNSLEDILKSPLCINMIPGYIQPTKTEMLIKKYDLDKHIGLRSNNMNLMLEVVKDSDFIYVTSSKCRYLLDHSYRCIDLPPELLKDTYRRELALFTHQANRNNPFTDWLQKEITSIIQS